MKPLKSAALFLLAAITGIMFTGCSGQKDQKTIDFVYVNWAEGIDMVYVAKEVLEENGYTVNLKSTDAAPLFASLAKGNADVFLETWLPVTHKDYMNKYGESLEKLGSVYNGAKLGLVVPDYVPIHSIEELNQYASKFDGEIVGIDAGAGLMSATEKAISAYDLDFNLLTSSEAGMTATLKKAIDKGKWVVVTGWRPHWMFSRFDLKMLDDPKGIYGREEKIIAVAREGFKSDHPFVAQFIENMHYSDDQMGGLMETFEEGSNNTASAKKWVSAHTDLINSWLPEKKEEKPVAEDSN